MNIETARMLNRLGALSDWRLKQIEDESIMVISGPCQTELFPCQESSLQSPEPGGSGPKLSSGGGSVLDSGECRFAGQGGLWQSSERAGPTPGQTLVNDGSISAPDVVNGIPTKKSKPTTWLSAEA